MSKLKIYILLLCCAMTHCCVAQQVSWVSDSLSAGRYQAALSLAIKIAEINKSENLTNYALALQWQGIAQTELGDYKNAELNLRTALALQTEDSITWAATQADLGYLFNRKGAFVKAITIFEATQKRIGADSLTQFMTYGKILNGLGVANCQLGHFAKAAQFLLQNKAFRLKTLGTQHADYAWALHNLGALYTTLGQLEKAEILYIEANTIREKVLGKQHPDYIYSLLNLGGWYDLQGKYTLSEPLYLEAEQLQIKYFGKSHIDYLNIKFNLASLYVATAKYETAIAYFTEVSNKTSDLFSKKHSLYSKSLNGLALAYFYQGKYNLSEQYYQAVISENAQQIELAKASQGLGCLYYTLGRYQEASVLLAKAQKIYSNTFGENSNESAECFNNLAALYFATHDFTQCAAISALTKS